MHFEDLLRRTKATAALRGMKMKDLVAELVESGLDNPTRIGSQRMGMNSPIPVTISADGRHIPSLTNAEIFEILDREDDHTHGRLS